MLDLEQHQATLKLLLEQRNKINRGSSINKQKHFLKLCMWISEIEELIEFSKLNVG